MAYDTDVAVVGGGPAGLSAAITAAARGARVVLVDEYPRLGGQYLKPAAAAVPQTRANRATHELRERLVGDARDREVTLLTDTLVWGAFGERTLMVYGEGSSQTLRADALVLATGAYDRPVPFPGWTLPGVMTAGAAQSLAKSYLVPPGERMLIVGSGPFLLPVAQLAAGIGVEVVAVVEAGDPRDWWRHAPATWGHWGRYAEAFDYLLSLRRARVPLRRRHKILRAEGSNALEAAVICRVDREWRRIPGSEERIEVDALAVGYGFVPSTELAEAMGCEMAWDAAGSYWRVAHDARLETTQPGVFAAGEITGIGGATLSQIEGRLAGLGAAEAVGATTAAETARERGALLDSRGKHLRFAKALNDIFSPREGLWEGLEAETVVCRCEEVKAGEIRDRVAGGCTTPKQVKDRTRAQMGLCQGRMCGPAVARLIAEGTGQAVEDIPRPSVRPPIKPVPIRALVDTEEP